MKCSDIEELLSAYANRELSRTQREFVEEHLSRCADCRAALADYTEVRQHLTSLRTTPALPDIKDATMSRIKGADILKKPIKRWTRPALIATPIVIILVVLLVLHPWSTSLGPGGLIAKAYAATMELQSYRMFSSIKSTLEGKASEATFETEFVAPDRYCGKATTNGDWVEFIIIGDKQYIRDSDPSRTTSVGISSSSILSKEDTLELLDTLTDLEKLPDEKIDGVDCFHYRGRVDIDHMVNEWKAELDPAQPGYEERLEALEQLRNMKTEVKLWIGRDDYLIRQVKQDTQVPSEDIGQWNTSSAWWKYYDFNEPIEIEPPEAASGELLPGWHLAGSHSTETYFHAEIDSEITGEDPAHQQISLSVTITNVGMEAASNVQVSLHNAATIRDEDEESWINAEPSIPAPVNLEPGESETYSASWEYDASRIAKDKITELVKPTRVRIIYTTPDGNEAVRLYSEGAPYPSKVPPERPPG